tara:strand:+ start:1596 stop:1859 length:264 start_codon:yes stop_codon:yes gene_type:complete
MSELKDIVAPPAQVHFQHYFDGALWYETDSGLSFPVPIDDIGNATFPRDDKAMLYMRYIRKQLNMLESEKRNVEEKSKTSDSETPAQ